MRVHEEVEVDEEVEVGRHQKQIGVDLLPNSPLRRSAGRSRARRREMFLELPGVNLCIISTASGALVVGGVRDIYSI